MSKASEWAEFLRSHRPPAFHVGEIIIAYINDSGELQPTGAMVVEQADAVAYGQWVLDMFSEPKATADNA